MKVYFDATPTGLDKYKNNYQKIVDAIEKAGNDVSWRFTLDFNPEHYSLPEELWGDHYKETMKALSDADLLVAEVSVSSLTVGQRIQHALLLGKPVIAFKVASRRDIFLGGASQVEPKLLVVDYTLDDIDDKVKEAFEYAGEWMATRFTMLLDGKVRRRLDEIATKGISRSEYIRSLIEKDTKTKK